MKRKRIPGLLLCLPVILILAGCSRPVELGGVYIVDEYDGVNETVQAFKESLGFHVEPTADGYSFTPIVLQEGELYALSDEPWGLLHTDKNRYRVFLYLGDLYGYVFGPEALEAELEKDSYIFNYYLDVKAEKDGLKGKLVGAGESEAIHLAKLEEEAR